MCVWGEMAGREEVVAWGRLLRTLQDLPWTPTERGNRWASPMPPAVRPHHLQSLLQWGLNQHREEGQKRLETSRRGGMSGLGSAPVSSTNHRPT